MAWLRWAIETVEVLQGTKHNQRGDRRRPVEPPPMEKLVSQRRKFQVFGKSVSEKSYRCRVQAGPLYRELGAVICPITSPRFMEANKSGVNLLNGYKIVTATDSRKFQVLRFRPSGVGRFGRPRIFGDCSWTTLMDDHVVHGRLFIE